MLKKILFLVVVGLCISFANAANVKSNINNKGEKTMTNFDDYQAVKATINKYLEAGKQGKSSIAKPAFHKDAIMYNANNGKIEGGAIQSLFDFFDTEAPAPDLQAEITSIDIAGNVAYARVESKNWHGESYSDMFLLLKENGEWKILTKVFHTN